MPLITIDLSSVRMPTGSDEEMTFHTFRNYLEATCNWASDLYPHRDGLLAGVAGAVKARPWRRQPPGTKSLSPRAGQILRNAWATEVLLNAPRTLGGDDLVSFATSGVLGGTDDDRVRRFNRTACIRGRLGGAETYLVPVLPEDPPHVRRRIGTGVGAAGTGPRAG